MLTVAAAQIDVAFGDKKANLATIRDRMSEAAARGARLVAFPECALTGYAFEDRGAAMQVAEPVPGPAVEVLRGACAEHKLWTIVGLLERDGDRLYNSVVLIGPDGVAARYRKLHLPVLGADRHVDPGNLPLEPAATPLGRIGMSICYDGSFPETGRVLKLRGAQLIVLPTNWPAQAAPSIQHQSIVRAFENHVNYVAVNRIGSEGGFRFPGGSQIVDFTGRVLAQAGDAPQVLIADLDLEGAERNRIVNIPGRYELDRIAHRRPEFYGPIGERH